MIGSFIARALNKTRFIRRYSKKDIIPVRNFNFILRIKLNQRVFKIPVLGKTGWENMFLTEGWFTSLLKYLKVESSWVILDIGANIGQTLLKVKCIDPEIKYYGIEPNPVCINYLYRLVELNKLSKIQIYPVGISDRTEIAQIHFFTESDSDSSASIVPEYYTGKTIKTEYVSVVQIKEIANLIAEQSINLIKIDVEGAEKEVVESCKALIEKHRPYIIIEVLPVYSSSNLIRKKKQEEIEKLILNLNYKIFLVKKDAKEGFKNLEAKNSFGIHGNIYDIDYLLVPIELCKNINGNNC